MFSSKFLSADPATHECSSAGTPPPSQETNQNMEHTFVIFNFNCALLCIYVPSFRVSLAVRLDSSGTEGPTLPPRNPSGPSYPLRRGDSFLSDDRSVARGGLTKGHGGARAPGPQAFRGPHSRYETKNYPKYRGNFFYWK